jgi:DNA-binding NarL/FixJ family response regulator
MPMSDHMSDKIPPRATATPPRSAHAESKKKHAYPKRRVLVVEDQTSICDLISEMVQSHPHCELSGSCTDGETAVSLSLQLRPDILLLDLIMPGVGGIEVLNRLSGILPNMKVLVFSAKQEPQAIRAILKAGIHGFVNKNSPLSELRKALEAIALGNNWFNEAFSVTVREAVGSPSSLDLMLVDHLTNREMNIAVLIASSHSSKEIAGKLDISKKTVENHRANIMRKMGVHDVAGLVRLVVLQGLSGH